MKIFISGLLFFFCADFSAQTYNYYFGNLHSHTAFSDGNKDAATFGISTPSGSYAYAKLSQNFDFLGISEHNHYSNKNNPGFLLPDYQNGLNMADEANEDGRFLCLFGMEYGVSSNYNGHVIVYGFNQLIGWESNVGGQSGNNYDIFNAKTDYDGLFRKVKNNPDAFCYLAHPYHTDFSNDGTYAAALAHAPYNAAYDSAIVGVPLRSGLATSKDTTYSNYPKGNYFGYFKNLLYIGYHIGIGYDHDNHYTNFGRSNGGRLVILAPSLTRQNLMSAMKQMHFYGSDDFNAKIEFTMNGNIMGSVLSGNIYPTFNVIHNDMDGEQADSIKIWRGSKGQYAQVVHTSLQNNTSTFTDNNITPNKEYYYFAEIKQMDGQWIVTSPIWYTASEALSVKGNTEDIKFNFFPNPVSKELDISVADCDTYSISITDVSSKKVFEKEYHNEEAVRIHIHNFQSGVYLLTVKNSKGSAVKKLIVE
ncbi:MAG: T9SS type A sorting domain-containing protein [Bacteroidetes bacterium]|nr:T9SS type A sorting domain-containing protein [Bacteroidota bacterium]